MSAKSLWSVASSVFLLMFQLWITPSISDRVELSLQICNDQSLNGEQREGVLKSFLSNIPIFGENAGSDIIPSLGQSCDADARHYIKKNNRSLATGDNFNEIDEKSTSQESVTAFISYENGQLHLISENASYTLQEFCISAKIKEAKPEKNKGMMVNFRIFKCESHCSKMRPCIRKCCGEGEAWDIMNSSCRTTERSSQNSNATDWHWDPTFYEVTSDGDCVMKLHNEQLTDSLGGDRKPEFHYKIGPPQSCADGQEWNAIPSRNIPGEFALGRFRMLLNGSVLLNYDNGSWIGLSQESYCVDEIHTAVQEQGRVRKSFKRGTKVLLVCKDEYKLKGPKRPIPYQYATMLYSAVTILFFIVIVYLLLWDRHSIYEWTVFFEVLSMFFMIVFVAVSHTVARDATEGYYGSKKCILLGMASHYFFLATFFWLFVINFELFWNFRTLTIRNRKSRKWLRLMCYHVFGFGGPAAIVLIGWLLDRRYGLQNDEIDCTSLIIPNYGQLNCYISKRAQGPYLYYPIGVLLGFNLLFYSMTVFKMCQYQKNSQQISRSKTNGQSQPVVVFARLFIVMGVSWIAEIVAWAFKPRIRGTVPLYWIVFDIVTLIQAIAIFFIFVFRRDILDNLIGKYPSLRFLSPLYRLPCFRKPTQTKNKTVANGTKHQRGTLASVDGDNATPTPKSICEQINLDDLNKDFPVQTDSDNIDTKLS